MGDWVPLTAGRVFEPAFGHRQNSARHSENNKGGILGKTPDSFGNAATRLSFVVLDERPPALTALPCTDALGSAAPRAIIGTKNILTVFHQLERGNRQQKLSDFAFCRSFYAFATTFEPRPEE